MQRGLPEPIPPDEHAQTIAALKPRTRERPVIAIAASNAGTEVCDLLTGYGALAESGVATVSVVAERDDPIRLYPALRAAPHLTMAAFNTMRPAGADYVVVPALQTPDDPGVVAFITAQHAKGATIVAVCDGALTLSAAGLLDGRRATGHWYSVKRLQARHPTMRYVRDRRYVADRGVATSTGITASLPLMIALTEAIGGRAAADALAARLGIVEWDARHDSAPFALTAAHRWTFIRNRLSFWRRETVGIAVDDGVDEIALGLMIDAEARTELTKIVAVGNAMVQSRRGLRLMPDAPTVAGTMLEPQHETPARALDHELARIASRYDERTAAWVALVMEYPRREQP